MCNGLFSFSLRPEPLRPPLGGDAAWASYRGRRHAGRLSTDTTAARGLDGPRADSTRAAAWPKVLRWWRRDSSSSGWRLWWVCLGLHIGFELWGRALGRWYGLRVTTAIAARSAELGCCCCCC